MPFIPSLSASPALAALFALLLHPALPAPAQQPAAFFRAINLNGPPLVIDERAWEGKDAPNLAVNGNAFENQSVRLIPATDSTRAQMIRSSRWGAKVDVELSAVPPGDYQIFLYVWEDNHSERFDLLVNDQRVLEGFHSGRAGAWKKLGPWPASSAGGKIKISARAASHGAANLSGIEVWTGAGPIPSPALPQFAANPTPEQLDFFERRVRPVLAESCYECHAASSSKIKGGLVLDSRAGIIKGGDTGPVITPGNPDASLLIEAVRHQSGDLAMPPKKKLPAQQIADLEAWVRMGAPDPRTENTLAAIQAKSAINWDDARQWWSFRPVASPPIPAVQQTNWPRRDLDRFILARLEAANLSPAPDASKQQLIRRATFNLIGLPPTPQEVENFLADPAPDAFAKVVDRLLASPHYGERWGRFWLDVVRYADSAGDNSDFPIPQMYRYRNWVIDAFNRDLPYDEFIRHQLAGDLLPAPTTPETRQRLIATGYIANARRFGSRVDDYPQHLTIEDTIDNLGRAFLGLTISCARCHDHKFDPITAEDYYALYGIFHSTRYPWPGIELEQKQRDLVPLVPPDQAAAALQAHQEKQAVLDRAVKDLETSLKTEETNGDAKKAIQTSLASAKKAADQHRKTPPPFEQAYAVAESSKIEDAPLQHKGDPAKPGDRVRRRFLTVLHGAPLPPDESSSGRKQLADWIATPQNPLTARVMVNRLWLHHFGKGLVPTPNDFGKQGKPPTHPDLLDWLASEFIKSGWSIKSMHRLIMLSRAYQLGRHPSPDAVAKDPNNDLLGSYRPRRLDAESLRDTLLVLGGALDTRPGGPHPFPPQTEWKFTQHNPFKAAYETPQRSVYLMTQRIQRHPYLAIFDGADPAASTPIRTASTTPLQALYLLNDAFFHQQSKQFGQRLLSQPGPDSERLALAYQLALARPPLPGEISSAKEFLARTKQILAAGQTPPAETEILSWQAFARVLFRLNEFAYID